MLGPIGTLVLSGKCYKIEIYSNDLNIEYACVQLQDEENLIWRLYLGPVEKLLEDNCEYFIKLMTTERLQARIKILDSVCENTYPRSFYCETFIYQ